MGVHTRMLLKGVHTRTLLYGCFVLFISRVCGTALAHIALKMLCKPSCMLRTCTCIHVYMHTCMYVKQTSRYTQTHTFIHARMHITAYPRLRTCACIHTAYLHARKDTHAYRCIQVHNKMLPCFIFTRINA